MNIGRRTFLTGLTALVASPVVVRAESLMQIRGESLYIPPLWCPPGFLPTSGELVPVKQFPLLFAHIGRTYSWAYDPADKFRLPNLSWPHFGPQARGIVSFERAAYPSCAQLPGGFQPFRPLLKASA